MIEVFKYGRSILFCRSHDWRTFVPGVQDDDFRWHMRAPPGWRWTWRWV